MITSGTSNYKTTGTNLNLKVIYDFGGQMVCTWALDQKMSSSITERNNLRNEVLKVRRGVLDVPSKFECPGVNSAALELVLQGFSRYNNSFNCNIWGRPKSNSGRGL